MGRGRFFSDGAAELTRLCLMRWRGRSRALFSSALEPSLSTRPLLFSLAFYYIRQFKPDLSFNTRNVMLVASPAFLALGLGRILLETVRNSDAAAYAFPAGIIGMLAVILLDARLGVLLVTIGALAFSIATSLDFKVFLTSLLGGYAAVAALTAVKERARCLAGRPACGFGERSHDSADQLHRRSDGVSRRSSGVGGLAMG